VKTRVLAEECIACGVCIDTCPAVFDWDEEGKSCVKIAEVPAGLADLVRVAASECPTGAIIIDD